MKKLEWEIPESAKECITNKDSFSKNAHVASEVVFTDSKVDNPLVSIIMPTYNADFVIDALSSAVNQIDAPEYEIVIVDNNSKPEYLDKLVKAAKDANSGKITIYKNSENVGMYGNWNRGAELAKADYFTYLHSDDLLVETCLRDLWDAHLMVEPDAAIITQERITYMDGRLVNEDRQPRARLGGLLKPKKLNKRIKLQLLHPHGNGCGHFFSKKVMKELGGYSVSGDQGCVLRYNLSHPVYDLYKITRIKRIGENESMNVAASFIPYGYYMREQVIEKKFDDNKFLHYVSRLEAESMSFSEYGVQALRELKGYEKLVLRLFNLYVSFKSKYTIF